MERSTFRTIALVLATTVGCATIQGDETVDEPALIIFHGDTSRITAPERTARDTPVEVRVQTFGGGCVREIARTDVTVQGQVAEIRPYNRRTVAEACTADLLFLDHVVEIQFPSTGTATIRVVGGETGPATEGRTVTAQLQRTIVVQ